MPCVQMHVRPVVCKRTRGSAGALEPSAHCTFHRPMHTGHDCPFHMPPMVGKRTRGAAGAPLGAPRVYVVELWENYGATMGQLWDNYGTTMGQPMGQPMGQLKNPREFRPRRLSRFKK